MDGSYFWIVAFVVAVVIIIIIAVIYEFGFTPPIETPLTLPSTPLTGILLSSCSATTPCNQGLVCSNSRCLIPSGGTCLNNTQCVSQVCVKGSDMRGVCQGTGISPPPTQPQQQSIYCYRNDNWVLSQTLLSGLVMTRISEGYNNRLLGISGGQGFIYTQASGWQNISSQITSPGVLIDGVIVGDDIWLVYQISTGRTLLYRFNQGILTPFGSAGGVQSTNQGIPIIITYVDASISGEVMLVGKTSPNGILSIYRYSSDMLGPRYNNITVGELVAIIPVDSTANNFSFVNGNSVFVVGTNNTRIDGINAKVTSMDGSSSGNVWYLTNNGMITLYNMGNVVPTTFNLSPSANIFWSSSGFCVAT